LRRDLVFHFQYIGGVTASVFIAFLKRLLAGARHVIRQVADLPISLEKPRRLSKA
jgi:hypothetical protein